MLSLEGQRPSGLIKMEGSASTFKVESGKLL